MSGTYALDGEYFPINPIEKRWGKEKLGTGGTGEDILSGVWQLELVFPTLASSDAGWFYDRWTAGGLHTAQLPHPRDGMLTGFTGVSIAEWTTVFNDVDRDGWQLGGRLMLGNIDMSATGTVV